MGLFDSLKSGVEWVKALTPSALKELSGLKLTDLMARETTKAKVRIDELQARYPSADKRELAQRLIDDKKNIASLAGGISGVFGVVTVPADLLVMVWLQMLLLVDLATVYKVNLKSEAARKELLDLFGEANGLGPMARSSPKVLGKLAAVVLTRGGLPAIGKAMPLVAAPVSAYLNNQHIQRVGDYAVRHFEGFQKARAKAKRDAPA